MHGLQLEVEYLNAEVETKQRAHFDTLSTASMREQMNSSVLLHASSSAFCFLAALPGSIQQALYTES